jgi:hypothetical protein
MARSADDMNQRDVDDRGPSTRRTGTAATTDGNGTAIAAMVIGFLAVTFTLLFFTLPAGILFGIIAIVLGAVGIGKANSLGGLHKGLAVTGLVTGVLALILAGLIIWGGVAALNEAEQEFQGSPELQQQLDELRQQIEQATEG